MATKIVQGKSKKRVPGAARFAMSANSAIAAITIVQPFDLIKSVMQVGGTKGTAYRNTWHCIHTIFAQEGIGGFYKGLGAAQIRQFLYTGTRVPLYISMNEAYKDHLQREAGVAVHLLMGMIAGGVAAFISTPTDLALVRQTTDRQLPPQHKRNYTSTYNALSRIYKEEGLLRMWCGSSPTILRAMVVTMIQLTAYSYFRRFLIDKFDFKEGFALHTGASLGSGFVTSVCSLPIDIAKTCIQNQLIINGKPEYTGMFDVLRKVVRNEGVLAMWKGFTPYFLRIAPHTVLLFFFLEQQNRLYTKYFLGVINKGAGL